MTADAAIARALLRIGEELVYLGRALESSVWPLPAWPDSWLGFLDLPVADQAALRHRDPERVRRLEDRYYTEVTAQDQEGVDP